MSACSLDKSRLIILKYVNKGIGDISERNWKSGGVGPLDTDTKLEFTHFWHLYSVKLDSYPGRNIWYSTPLVVLNVAPPHCAGRARYVYARVLNVWQT